MRRTDLGRLAIVVAASLAGVGSGCGGSRDRESVTNPLPPPSEGHIVFRVGGWGDIHVIKADGTDEVNLTQSAYHEDEPVLSPDGQTIAFARDLGGGNLEIFLMNTDGSNLHQITDSPGRQKHDVGFTADGTQIVYSSGYGPYVVNLADGTETAWTVTPSYPRFSADARQIVYVDYDEEAAEIVICTADGDGSNRISILEDCPEGNPDISPDGSKIVFASTRHHEPEPGEPHYYNTELYIMDTDGQNLQRLTYSDESLEYEQDSLDEDPCFSPDGSMIAFFSRQGGPTGIWTITIDGQNRTRLTIGSSPHWGS